MKHTKKSIQSAIKATINDIEEDLDVSILNEHSVKSQIKALVNIIVEVLEDQGYEEDEEDDLVDNMESPVFDYEDDDEDTDFLGFDILDDDETL